MHFVVAHSSTVWLSCGASGFQFVVPRVSLLSVRAGEAVTPRWRLTESRPRPAVLKKTFQTVGDSDEAPRSPALLTLERRRRKTKGGARTSHFPDWFASVKHFFKHNLSVDLCLRNKRREKLNSHHPYATITEWKQMFNLSRSDYYQKEKISPEIRSSAKHKKRGLLEPGWEHFTDWD